MLILQKFRGFTLKDLNIASYYSTSGLCQRLPSQIFTFYFITPCWSIRLFEFLPLKLPGGNAIFFYKFFPSQRKFLDHRLQTCRKKALVCNILPVKFFLEFVLPSLIWTLFFVCDKIFSTRIEHFNVP